MFGARRPVISAESAPISFGSVAYNIIKIAFPMMLSYTFSGTIIVASIMADHAPGDTQKNLAASALIMPMLMTMVAMMMAD